MSGKGQVHTLEAIIASVIILTTLFVAMSIPNPKSGISNYRNLQLKKYADDVLTLLTIENKSYESILTYYARHDWNGFRNYFKGNISEPLLENLSIGTNVTIFNVTDGYRKVCSAGYPLPKNGDVVSSFTVLIVNDSVYEVRLYVWFV